MPLSSLQTEILRILAGNRQAQSYVAGGIVLNRSGKRYSNDIDIFHDREEAVATSALKDEATLIAAGFAVAWIRREPGIYTAVISRNGESTRLEWVRDSDFRFFPTAPHDLFGFRLHIFDVATNKALAAAGRDEPRDVLDMLHIHEKIVPLGAVIWAAVAKDPGFTPESLISEIRRNARYRQPDYDELALEDAVDAGDVARRLRAALAEAERFIASMPGGKIGLAFLEGGRVVQPDPDNLERYMEVAPHRQALWPSSSEIASAMLPKDDKI